MSETTKATISEAVPATRQALDRELRRAREYTLSLYADLPTAYWQPDRFPYLPVVNPPLWELGHIAYFAEFFCLRWRPDDVRGECRPSRLPGADALFDSNRVAHRLRWTNAYPSRDEVWGYIAASLTDVLDALAAADERASHSSLYPFQLALLHEDMHAEALAMTRATLGLPRHAARPGPVAIAHPAAKSVAAGGTSIALGGGARHFRFDNEDGVVEQDVAPFEIDATPVTARDVAAFRRSREYDDDRLWSAAGQAWRCDAARIEPDRDGDGDRPAVHVAYFEAEAYAAALGRRLPSEAEWECAIVQSVALRASTGQTWEWTASHFLPRPGFVPGPYAEYSQPWFGTHMVLKGGSFATHPRLKYPQYRNFYLPDRRDLFAGFRTCRTI